VGQSPDLVVFLSLVQRTWQDFCDQMLIIRGIALLLDVKYVKNVANICSVWDMGLQLFCKHLSLSPEIDHKTVTGLLRLIESERYAYSSVISSINHICSPLITLTICESFFCSLVHNIRHD
jgi:cullin 4